MIAFALFRQAQIPWHQRFHFPISLRCFELNCFCRTICNTGITAVTIMIPHGSFFVHWDIACRTYLWASTTACASVVCIETFVVFLFDFQIWFHYLCISFARYWRHSVKGGRTRPACYLEDSCHTFCKSDAWCFGRWGKRNGIHLVMFCSDSISGHIGLRKNDDNFYIQRTDIDLALWKQHFVDNNAHVFLKK